MDPEEESLTSGHHCGEAARVIEIKPDRPYFDAWLKRARRHFAVSGRLSQTAVLLAAESGGDAQQWRERLDAVLNHGEAPGLELLTRIEVLLASPAASCDENSAQGMLFPQAE